MIKRKNRVMLIVPVLLILMATGCSNVRFLKQNLIAKFGEGYHPCHPILQTEGGAYFLTRNDTVFPSALLIFNNDGSLFETSPSYTPIRYINNDSASVMVSHIPDQELGLVRISSDGIDRYDYCGLHSTQSYSIYKIVSDTIVAQSFSGLYGKNIFGLQSWSFYIYKYIIESDSSIVLISEQWYYEKDYQPITQEKHSRYVFHKTPYPVSTYDKYDYRYCFPWLWQNRKEWKAWKKAHGRK